MTKKNKPGAALWGRALYLPASIRRCTRSRRHCPSMPACGARILPAVSPTRACWAPSVFSRRRTPDALIAGLQGLLADWEPDGPAIGRPGRYSFQKSEAALRERIRGRVAGKLHTARSRNDQGGYRFPPVPARWMRCAGCPVAGNPARAARLRGGAPGGGDARFHPPAARAAGARGTSPARLRVDAGA